MYWYSLTVLIFWSVFVWIIIWNSTGFAHIPWFLFLVSSFLLFWKGNILFIFWMTHQIIFKFFFVFSLQNIQFFHQISQQCCSAKRSERLILIKFILNYKTYSVKNIVLNWFKEKLSKNFCAPIQINIITLFCW